MIWIGGNILLKTILLFAVFGLSICDEYRIAWLAPTDPYDGIEASSTVGGLILALNSIETQGILPGDNFTCVPFYCKYITVYNYVILMLSLHVEN